jgi:hypothetical protein
MSVSEKRRGLALRRLPPSARSAAAGKAAERSAEIARSRFSRTFADVLSGRFGGRWSVEWDSRDRGAGEALGRDTSGCGKLDQR